MNPDLAKQQDAFRNSLRSQPIISRPVPGDESKEEPRKEIPKAIQETLRFDDSSTIRHINSYVHSILSVLKISESPMTIEEVFEKLNINLNLQSDLLQILHSNEKIEIIGRYLTYKRPYSVGNSQELMQLLQEKSNISGVLVQDLVESCKSIESLVQEKVISGDIISFKGKDDSNRVVFRNQLKMKDVPNEEIQSLWFDIKIPLQQDLENSLLKAGIKCLSSSSSGAISQFMDRNPVNQKKTAKKFNRRIKITNTHIEGLDFSKDSTIN